MGLQLIRRSSSSSVSTTEDFVVESLAEHYSFPLYGDVRNFLKTEPQVASVLFTAREAIDVHFGNGTLAALRLSRGSDSNARTCRELLVIIRSFQSADETIVQLENFDNALWNENVSVEVRSKVLFMVEFA
ncbi:MAG: hypothetical protein JWL77_2913 [Chthonomonadaceae bacterium]|nr:hypothetical protein [Chthonomonadaceae bacterium]